MYSSQGRLLHSYLDEREQRFVPVSLGSVHSNVIAAILATEDQRFFNHPGIDPAAVLRASYNNLRTGSIQSGASTLTMQLARLMDPADRTLWNKIVESLRAVQIERRFTKREILERYLNHLPFGGNIRGIETASRVYYGKPAKDLTVPQAALLAGIPQDPVRYHPLRHPARARERRNFVLKRMWEEGYLTEAAYRDHRQRSLDVRRHALPFRAPHFSELIHVRGKEGSVRTSLNLSLQRTVRSLARNYVSRLQAHGIRNLSVVVLDNETREILAYQGSQNFYDDTHGGQVQGPLAVRSPGSALKPFLYAAAFQSGQYTPTSRLPDVPTHFVGMSPRNYNRTFNGVVSIRQALKQSLNVPAVRLLRHGGVKRYKQFLQTFGFNHMNHPAKYYGLGLVLGGSGVTLLELTNAYATLASGGFHQPVSTTRVQQPVDGERVLSPGVAYLIHDILKVDAKTFRRIPFAYKTGTSSNHRDAWTVAYNPEITVGVWTGNFDGEPAKRLLGRRTALPLAQKIFHAYYRGRPGRWFDRPDPVRSRTVCSVSGRIPNSHCDNTTRGLTIQGITRPQVCNVHQLKYVSKDRSVSYGSGCIRGHDYDSVVVERFSPVVTRFFRRRGMIKTAIPPHNPQCPYYRTRDGGVSILQPTSGTVYRKEPGTSIPIKAASEETEKKLFVFVDGKYLQRLKTRRTLFYAPRETGKHTLTVVDYTGNRSRTHFTVK